MDALDVDVRCAVSGMELSTTGTLECLLSVVVVVEDEEVEAERRELAMAFRVRW